MRRIVLFDAFEFRKLINHSPKIRRSRTRADVAATLPSMIEMTMNEFDLLCWVKRKKRKGAGIELVRLVFCVVG